MLIVLSGSETIHKRFFAKKILTSLNTFVVDGYTVDLRYDQFAVYDSTGKKVFAPHHEETAGFPYTSSGHTPTNALTYTRTTLSDVVPDAPDLTENHGQDTPVSNSENGLPPTPHAVEPTHVELNLIPQATVEKIYQLYNSVLALHDVNHFQNFFVDLESDYGNKANMAIPEWEEKPQNQFAHPHTYQDVVDSYRSRNAAIFPNYVISGSFSKRFIDMLRNDLGATEVVAINVVRHPSVAYALHEKEVSNYDPSALMNQDIDEKKIQIATVNCANLARFSDVITVRFEDILKTGYLEVLGVPIELPEYHTNYNDLITVWERDHLLKEIVKEHRLASWNDFLSNGIRAAAASHKFPANIFEVLGYAPLTRNQIVAPKV